MKPISTQVEVFIPRPPQTVFEYFADLRHEPEYNARVHDVRKTTDGPLTCGTRFEGLHDGIGTVSWTLVEFDALYQRSDHHFQSFNFFIPLDDPLEIFLKLIA